MKQADKYLEICFPAPDDPLVIIGNETLKTLKQKMSCHPFRIDDGNYVSIVQSIAPSWESWCVDKPPLHIIDLDKRQAYRKINSVLDKLAQHIFSQSNISITEATVCSAERYLQLDFAEGNNYRTRDVTMIYTDFEGYQFLSCHTEPYITFQFYFTPFQVELWIVLGIMLGTIIVVTTLVHHFWFVKESKPAFAAWLFVLASLFEEGSVVPGRIERMTFFRLCLGIWCLMSVILTNGYNGIMIYELNSPRRQSHPETFGELRCQNEFGQNQPIEEVYNIEGAKRSDVQEAQVKQFDLFYLFVIDINTRVPLNAFPFGSRVDINNTNVDATSKCYKLLSHIHKNLVLQVLPEFLSVLFNLVNSFMSKPVKKNHTKSRKSLFGALDLFNEKHDFYPMGFSYLNETFMTFDIMQGNIERQVVQCGKTVLIGKSSVS